VLRRAAVVRTDVSLEPVFHRRVTRLLVTANVVPSSPILVTLIPPKRRFLQAPRAVISKKMAFFIVTALNTSNLT
jgi:hypothetical protein